MTYVLSTTLNRSYDDTVEAVRDRARRARASAS